jgi:hypothetical protein
LGGSDADADTLWGLRDAFGEISFDEMSSGAVMAKETPDETRAASSDRMMRAGATDANEMPSGRSTVELIPSSNESTEVP